MLVTGAARGIGLAIARRFAADGAHVIVADLDADAARAAAESLPGAGHLGLAADVADEASVAAMFDAAEADGSPMPLMLTDRTGITRSQIDASVRSLWRYSASFPLECASPISLGEGCTPLVRRPFGSGGGEVETQRALGRGAGRCASSRRTR